MFRTTVQSPFTEFFVDLVHLLLSLGRVKTVFCWFIMTHYLLRSAFLRAGHCLSSFLSLLISLSSDFLSFLRTASRVDLINLSMFPQEGGVRRIRKPLRVTSSSLFSCRSEERRVGEECRTRLARRWGR